MTLKLPIEPLLKHIPQLYMSEQFALEWHKKKDNHEIQMIEVEEVVEEEVEEEDVVEVEAVAEAEAEITMIEEAAEENEIMGVTITTLLMEMTVMVEEGGQITVVVTVVDNNLKVNILQVVTVDNLVLILINNITLININLRLIPLQINNTANSPQLNRMVKVNKKLLTNLLQKVMVNHNNKVHNQLMDPRPLIKLISHQDSKLINLNFRVVFNLLHSSNNSSSSSRITLPRLSSSNINLKHKHLLPVEISSNSNNSRHHNNINPNSRTVWLLLFHQINKNSAQLIWINRRKRIYESFNYSYKTHQSLCRMD